MTAPKTRRTLSSLLIGSLLLCAAPKPASSQQTANGALQVEQVLQICLNASAQQALAACESLATLSQWRDSPAEVRLIISARLRDVLVELGRYGEALMSAREAMTAAEQSKDRGELAVQLDRLATVLQHLGDYKEAETLFRHAIALELKEHGAECLHFAALAQNLSLVLKDQHKLPEAERYLRLSISIFEKNKHEMLPVTLNNLAMVIHDKGAYKDAESMYRKALHMNEEIFGRTNRNSVKIRVNLAQVLRREGKMDESESLLREALTVQQQLLDPDHPGIAWILVELGITVNEQGRYDEGVLFYRRALSLLKNRMPADHPEIGRTLHALGVVLSEQGMLVEAESLLQQALTISRRHFDEGHPHLTSVIVSLAIVQLDQGHPVDAEKVLREVLAVQTRKLSAGHPEIAWTQNALSRALQDQFQLAEAETFSRRSLTVLENKLGLHHHRTAQARGQLAEVLRERGKLVEAETLLLTALIDQEKALGPDNRLALSNRKRLIDEYIGQERFDEAEASALKVLDIELRTRSTDATEIAKTKSLIGIIKMRQGKFKEADSFLRSALAIKRQKLDPFHPSLAVAMGNLAALRLSDGKPEEAESYLRDVLAIQEKTLSKTHPYLARTIGHIGGVLHVQGKLAEAESQYLQSLAIQQIALFPEHSAVLSLRSRLAFVRQEQRKYSDAEKDYRELLAVLELNPTHNALSLSEVLCNFSVLRLSEGKLVEAVQTMQKSLQWFDYVLRTGRTEDAAEALLRSQGSQTEIVYGLPLLPGAPEEAAHLAMSTALLFKGRTLEAGRMVRRELQQGLKTEEQKHKYQTMRDLLGQRDQELVRMAQGRANRERAQELLWQAQQLERELSKEVGVQSSANSLTLVDVTQNVAQSIPKDAVLVELALGQKATYSLGSMMELRKTRSLDYVALLLFPKGEVRVVKLGGKDEVEEATRTFLAALNQPNSKIEDVASSAYTKLFAPLEKELAGVHQVILSPDGALSAIPFGALHDGKGYLADRLSFRYITSGRELLNLPSQKPTTQPAVMMATKVPGQDTLVVAEKVGQDIAKTQNAKLTERATDGQVLAQQSPSVLTLISHGYFGGDSKEGGMSARLPTRPKRMLLSKYMGLMGFERDIAPQAKLVMAEKEKTEELMNSSGLMMMPGSQASTDTRQDGRLTAVEVREMNLQGTKLVMLLACKGAAGGLSFGQGVYGLRRAVLQAGAETVVGTLWSVEEKSASDLAKNYMTKLWTDKKATRVGAMEAAMKEMRSNPRYSHPHYWAPFVVMGMDGPLGN